MKRDKVKAWTDYPIEVLGDWPSMKYEDLRIRECTVLAYDGDKYVVVEVEKHRLTIKAGYVYKSPGKCGGPPCLDGKTLNALAVELKEFDRLGVCECGAAHP